MSEGPEVKQVTLWGGDPLSLLGWLSPPSLPLSLSTCPMPRPLESEAECLSRTPQLLSHEGHWPGCQGAGCRGPRPALGFRAPWKRLAMVRWELHSPAC